MSKAAAVLDPLETLREAPRRLEAILVALPRPLVSWTPAPGAWSIHEIVCHLRDMEREAYRERYRRLVAGGEAPPLGFDPDHEALVRLYREQRFAEAVRDWKRLRKETVQLLEGLAAAGGDGPGWAALATQHAEHDRVHFARIESLRERHAILGRLESTPRAVREALAAFPRGLLERGRGSAEAPAAQTEPSTRSALDAVHDELAAWRDFEARALGRYRAILERDRPALVPLDARPLPVSRGTAAPLETYRDFERLRALAVLLLHALSPQLWERRGVHPQRGDLSIAELVAQQLDHDAARTRRLRELVAGQATATSSPAASRSR